MIRRFFTSHKTLGFTAAAVLAVAVASCSGGGGNQSTLTAPAPNPSGAVVPPTTGFVPLTMHVRVPSGSAAKGIAVSAYQGTAVPSRPTVVADISGGTASNCAAEGDGSHLCTIGLTVPAGTDNLQFATYDTPPSGGEPRGNLTAPKAALNGQTFAGRQNAINVSLQGQVASVALDPSATVTVADGAPHDYPLYLNAKDSNGYFIVGGAALHVASLAVANDPIHTLSISPPASTAVGTPYTIHYNGGTLNDARVTANIPGISAPAIADVTPFNVAPGNVNLPLGSTIRVTASMALFPGPYTAMSTAPQVCSVGTPAANGDAATAGGIVQFTVTPIHLGNCTVAVTAQNVTQNVAVDVTSGRFVGTIGSHIKHVVFIIQENRSFDNLFGGFDANNGNKPFPGADTWSNPEGENTVPPNSLGTKIKMVQGTLLACYSPAHDHFTQLTAIDDQKMDGFGSDIPQAFACPTATAPPPPANYSYQYLNEAEVDPYWKIAEKYAIADHNFEEVSSASFTSHQYLIAAQAGNVVDNPSARPWGCDSPPGTTVPIYNDTTGQILTVGGPFPCFSYRTMADNFEAQGLDWRYYAPLMSDFGYQWSAYDASSQVRLNDSRWNAHIVEPSSQILTDVAGSSTTPAYLAPMTYVVPTLATSDHGRGGSSMGPPWVESVVNAIGQSQFWDSTAIFIMWDDYGGFYDHVPIPAKPVTGLSYGLRVPVIVVSPYAKPHFVSHKQHSWGGLLKFTEEVFNLPSLGGVDAQENDDFTDMFNLTSPPQPFTPFTMNTNMRDVIKAATDPGPPPDDDL